ncbi:transposase [Granulicella sp. L46]|uniref:transposase n=1 Tax=Granulicella sp. L46 TaxID=1641865 RepID=UPI003528A272
MVPQQSNTYAISISTFLQHRHFQHEANAELFLKTLLRYRHQGKFELHGFAIMPDHVHLLITPALDQSLPKCIQLIKGGYSFAARSLTQRKSGTPAITNIAFAIWKTTTTNSATSPTTHQPQNSSLTIGTSTLIPNMRHPLTHAHSIC